MKFFINQTQFFQKLDKNKYSDFENNLSGLINIFIILKNYWIDIYETEILEKSLKLNAFKKNIGWKYSWLIELFNFYKNISKNNFNFLVDINIFNTSFFHNFKLKKIFYNFENKYFIASVNFWENHLIIIEKVINNIIYYKSVWTKYKKSEENWKINFKDFFKIYNKRWILIEKRTNKN